MATQEPREIILKKLRELGSSRRGRRNRFAELPDHLLLGVFDRLKSGYANAEIARWLHEEMPELGNSVDSTSRLLKTFREKTVSLLATPPSSAALMPSATVRVPTKAEIEHAALSGLEGLRATRDQFKRVVDQLNAAAERSGVPHKKLAELNKTLIDYDTKIQRMEAEDAKRPRFDTGPTAHQRATFKRFMEGLPDGGQSMIKATDQLLAAVEDITMSLEVRENGTHEIRPTTEAERIKDLALGICGGLSLPPDLDRE